MKSSVDDLEEQEGKQIDYVELISALWKKRKFIGLFTFCVTFFALIIVFVMPDQYKSTAVILPDIAKPKLVTPSTIPDLSAMGLNATNEVSLARLYPTMIKSESVLNNVIYRKYKTKKFKDSVDLIQFWEIEENTPEQSLEVAIKRLRGLLEVNTDIKLNVITLSIETREPQLSADILNNIIQELNDFILTKQTSTASEERKWIEKRLVEVKRDLERAENALKEFREKNRMVSGSPQLMLEQARLEREVQINSTLYIELKKQYEIARIEEIKSIPVVNVMDYAKPATKKSSPKRGKNTLVALIISLFLAVSFVFIEYRYKTTIEVVKNRFGVSGSKRFRIRIFRS